MSIKGGSTLISMSVDETHIVALAAPQSLSEPFFCFCNHKYIFVRTSYALEKLHERLEKRGLAHLVPLMATWLGHYKQPYSWFYVYTCKGARDQRPS